MSIGAPDYREYINSDDWKLRRVAALKRSISRSTSRRYPACEVCGKEGHSHKNSRSRLDSRERRFRVDYSNGLEVHHLHYRNLGQEEPEDLIVLCTDVLYYGGHQIRSERWVDSVRINAWKLQQELGIDRNDAWARAKAEAGPAPELPKRVGCHERVHDDRSFRREVDRIASERA